MLADHVDLMFFQAMTYSINRRVDDIVYFREHRELYVVQ